MNTHKQTHTHTRIRTNTHEARKCRRYFTEYYILCELKVRSGTIFQNARGYREKLRDRPNGTDKSRFGQRPLL